MTNRMEALIWCTLFTCVAAVLITVSICAYKNGYWTPAPVIVHQCGGMK